MEIHIWHTGNSITKDAPIEWIATHGLVKLNERECEILKPELEEELKKEIELGYCSKEEAEKVTFNNLRITSEDVNEFKIEFPKLVCSCITKYIDRVDSELRQNNKGTS